MDRHPQQIKRERQDKKRRARNIAQMSKLKTAIKKVTSATNHKKAEIDYNVNKRQRNNYFKEVHNSTIKKATKEQKTAKTMRKF